MLYNIYTIYDRQAKNSNDLFLSVNDVVAKQTFENHLKKLAETTKMDYNLLKNSLLLINLGSYNTEYKIKKTDNEEIYFTDNPIGDNNQPYVVDMPPVELPERLKIQNKNFGDDIL